MRRFSIVLASLVSITSAAPTAAAELADGAPRRHWSFAAPVRPVVPTAGDAAGTGSANPIDAFILARLDAEMPGTHPAPEADPSTLIRRVYLDLIGLPPSIGEVEAFIRDERGDVYERVVDRLLNSPAYGERWARWWLDIARYADSNGYSIDAPRQIWLYRDWVIDAMNRDLPFDRFVVEQLAGDLLPEPTTAQRIATGFHRNTQINQEGGIDREQFRIESVVDRLATTGTAFLGLTIACAQCHNHKFDPISQEEYYRLFAFFNDQDEPDLRVPNPALDHAALDTESEHLVRELTGLLEAAATDLTRRERELTPEAMEQFDKPTRAALEVKAGERSFKQRRMVYRILHGNDSKFKNLDARLTALETMRNRFVTTMVMAERDEPRQTHIHIKGDFTRKGRPVEPAVPAVLHSFPELDRRPTRLDLARWLTRPDNPLLARVTVNRVWQQYFGKGLVETENDFGTQGLPPSHPELLDWLAVEFMEGPQSGETLVSSTASPDRAEDGRSKTARSFARAEGLGGQGAPWSLKGLHRLIVTSATYRQSSKVRPELLLEDPTNRWLARQSRLRLDAELIRDMGLSVSGTLSPKIGGPGVRPPQPDGVMALGQVNRQWKPDRGEDRYRRGIYTFFFRATPHPALTVFDAPDAFSACSRRSRSNTPLQALTLLNDTAFVEFAAHFAERIARECPDANDDTRLTHAFRLCLARTPDAQDLDALRQVLEAERRSGDTTEHQAWTAVARVLLNLDETITRE